MSKFHEQIQLINESIFKGASDEDVNKRRLVHLAINAYKQLTNDGVNEITIPYSSILTGNKRFIVSSDNDNIQQITTFLSNIPKYLNSTDSNDIIIIVYPFNRGILDFFINEAHTRYNNEQKKQELINDLKPGGDILFVSNPDGIITFSINDNPKRNVYYFIAIDKSSKMVKILKELAESPTTTNSVINS